MIPAIRKAMHLIPFTALAGLAAAQDLSYTPATPPAHDAAPPTALDASPELGKSDPKLEIGFAPFFWLSSMSGDTTIHGIKINTDYSFADILDDTSSVFGLEGAIDFKYERFVFQVNGTYVRLKIEDEKNIFRNTELTTDTKFNLAWYEFFAGYRFFEAPLGKEPGSNRLIALDAFVGGRVTSLDVKAGFSALTTITLPRGDVLNFGESREIDESADWFEPFVGLRLAMNLSEHWEFQVRGDIGGFGVDGSDFAWQTVALVGYRWDMDGWTLAAFGGFRALGQDYSSGDFGWNEVLYGPLMGLQAAFAF